LSVKILTFSSGEFVFLPPMTRILHIETATDVCSVCIAEDGKIISLKETAEGRNHAVSLAVFIKDVFSQSGYGSEDLDALAVSKGPGSYTGLRIGVSTAKGFCYGADIPLIAVNSLQSMTAGIVAEFVQKKIDSHDSTLFLPMIDARRMEVYTAFLDYKLNFVKDTHALIIEGDTFNELSQQFKLIMFGSGADKLDNVINNPNIDLVKGFKISSSHMAELALEKFRKKEFMDLAYFEPFYLKDFITTTPRKKIL
jgi:tRNA threonylcarbamoyladenosine biosynthesis protein TsaB